MGWNRACVFFLAIGEVAGERDGEPRPCGPAAVPPLCHRNASPSHRGIQFASSPPYGGEEGGRNASGGNSGQALAQLLDVSGAPFVLWCVFFSRRVLFAALSPQL